MPEKSQPNSSQINPDARVYVLVSQILPIILILPILSMNSAEMMLPGSTAKLPRKLTM